MAIVHPPGPITLQFPKGTGRHSFFLRTRMVDGAPGDVEKPPEFSLSVDTLGVLDVKPQTGKGVFQVDFVSNGGIGEVDIVCGAVDGNLDPDPAKVTPIGPFTRQIQCVPFPGSVAGVFDDGEESAAEPMPQARAGQEKFAAPQFC